MKDLLCLDEVDSTNSYIRRNIAELPNLFAVTARLQTAGRGRRGHTWEANGGMLPLSVLIKDPVSPETLTLRAGAAVCEALGELCGGEISPEIGIKWPNDVIIGSRKVCGILCESVCSGDSIDVICGIGVNLTQDEDFFVSAGIPHGASLKMLTGTAPDRSALCERIVEKVRRLCECDFGAVYERYKRLCVTLGKQVRIIGENGERVAFALDIAPNGFLVCKDENGFFEVNSGEVSVRGIMDYV